MTRFLVKRLIGLFFILLGVTFITFILGYFAPGDPIKESMGDHFNPVLWQQLRHSYGFDLPWYQQYLAFLVRLSHFDLGTSFHPQQRAVWDILKDGVPISVELSLWGTIVMLMMGIPLGIITALKANTWIDTLSMGASLILYALPSFILAVFVQVLVLWIDKSGVGWPVSGWGTPWSYDWSNIQYKIVPILTYGLAGYAYYARLTRTTMLDVLRQDYVRTARAKGLHENIVIYRHALRNAVIPLITAIGLLLGLLVTGSFFIENIFSIPGIANITVAAVSQRNYPVIQATTIMVAIGVVVGNLFSDVLYGIVDPRIKSE
ncbi:ABC transporter permease [Dictyobacter arantiisoli]|uniref:Peptide ABC transporter permease n=1 Tax=Dictyobacter arantiisoli TaxID=2014874 RepID=A0A5A5T6Z5_9CHLR|nr:ABC transporter permease [Dictyobacter arantiisoli]GCF06956.1 peptide ABC transporter permease [Dictyobacter arantiisoli]